MSLMRTAAVFMMGVGVMYVSVRGSDPEAADKGLQNMANGGSGVATASGYVAGDVLRATGPVIAGGKDALQSSGLGQMLTPDTVPAATQPDPEP